MLLDILSDHSSQTDIHSIISNYPISSKTRPHRASQAHVQGTMHTTPPPTWSSTRPSKSSLFFSSPRFLGASQLRTPQGRPNRACLVRSFEQLSGQEDTSRRRIVIIINPFNESYCVCCSRSARSSLSFVLPDRIRGHGDYLYVRDTTPICLNL